jgi:hypothetical protein
MTNVENRRRAPRLPVHWPARVVAADGTELQAVIADHSEGCFGVRCANSYGPGDSLTLSVPDIGTFVCDVIWANASRFGVRIRSEISEIGISELARFLDDCRHA